jgi:TBC1 domain family protein 5
MIARGIIERGESLGINKTLMSAVSEIRVSPTYNSFVIVNCLSHPFAAEYTGLVCFVGQTANSIRFLPVRRRPSC